MDITRYISAPFNSAQIVLKPDRLFCKFVNLTLKAGYMHLQKSIDQIISAQ